MLERLRTFFSNGGYATWIQSVIIIVSVLVAIYSIRETESNLSVTNSVGLAQKYFTEQPMLASANLRLRISQFGQVQEAKKTINGYDEKADAGFDRLFEAARPLVRKKIEDTPALQNDYHALDFFFSAMFICTSAAVCDRPISVRLLALEVLGFFNAVCPYMGSDEDTPRYIAFLVESANYRDSNQYFCRDRLSNYVAQQTQSK
jgi:hypothetical protein